MERKLSFLQMSHCKTLDVELQIGSTERILQMVVQTAAIATVNANAHKLQQEGEHFQILQMGHHKT